MATELEDTYRRAAGYITERIIDEPSKSMKGARIGQVLRDHFPVAAGKMSLTRMLDTYAPQLTIIGRSGSDLVWGTERSDDAPDFDIDDVLVAEGDAPTLTQPQTLNDMFVHSARFVNYRSLSDIEFVLNDLTVIVGANGAGKTNILDGLFRGVRLTQNTPASVFSGRNHFDRVRSINGSTGFEIHLLGAKHWSFSFTYDPDSGTSFQAHTGGPGSKSLPSLSLTPLRTAFGPATHLRLSATALSRPTTSAEVEPFLRHDGLYLPSVLSHLGGADRARLQRIVEKVQTVLPQVLDVRTPRRALKTTRNEVLNVDGVEVSRPVTKTVMGHELEVKMQGSGWIPADQLSEGTLLVLGLHTVLSRERPPKLLLLDDVDRALHPNAQMALMSQLSELAHAQCRIVCTSHSPFVLDGLPASAVRVAQMDDSGRTHVRRLDEHPEWPEYQDHLNAAEFWLHAGDDWVIPNTILAA